MNPGRTRLEKYKPGVPKAALLFLAGALWVAVGAALDGVSYAWLRTEPDRQALTAFAVGFACALVVHHFGFIRIVNRNLERILRMEGKRCLFSFIPWKSYGLIVLMMLMGYVLRHAPIPKVYLAVLYIAMGTALMLSSIRYLRHLILLLGKRRSG